MSTTSQARRNGSSGRHVARFLATALAVLPMVGAVPAAAATASSASPQPVQVILAPEHAPTSAQCPARCPTIWAPVCGVDLTTGQTRTFSNECVLRRHNCDHNTHYVVLHPGRCS